MFIIAFIAIAGLTWVIYSSTGRFSELLRASKKAFAWLYLSRLKKSQNRIFQYSPDARDVRKAGLTASAEEWFCEKPRLLYDKPYMSDVVEFWGVDNNGNGLHVCFVQRQERVAETRIYLKLKCGEEYQAVEHPDARVCNTSTAGTVFSAGGLVLEVLDPLRTWRILFRGLLRKGIHEEWSQGKEELIKVCFTFIWHPAYNHFVLNQNFNINMVSEAMSKMKFRPSLLKRFKVSPDDLYEQWGQMMGTLQIDGSDETHLNLWGPKIRSHGILNWKNTPKKIRLYLHVENGSVLSLHATDNNVGLRDITHGYLALASNFGNDTISKIDLNVEEVFRADAYAEELKCTFVAKNETYTFNITMGKHGYRIFNGNNWDAEITSKIVTGSLNGDKCVGFIEFSRPYAGSCPEILMKRQTSLPLLKEIDVVNCDRLVLKLQDPACQNSKLVGGKGASLALMTTIKNSPEKFEIPAGLCLSKNAFSVYLTENDSIQKSITCLEHIAWKIEDGCLKSQCELVSSGILNSKISSGSRAAIKEQLNLMFGDHCEEIKLAVRSSAIGEDGSEISAAGQNETVLGVIGLQQICEAVLKCWASQFAFRAIEYKRQNGQLLNPGMGVVIQQMVPSETSGVTFTGDPVTGAFGYVTITANYGLGETVVSAMSDPDTIILRRRWDDRMALFEKQIGKKTLKITLKSDRSGTEQQQIGESESAKCTLSDVASLKLGRIAVFLEKAFGGPRDIEWAIYDGRIFLLQCRPITTVLQSTQYEIMHEFDTPRITDHEMLTRANVGEVMPGALSTLTITSIKRTWVLTNFHIVKHSVQRYWYNPLSLHNFGMITYCNQFLSDRVYQKLFGLSKEPSPFANASQLGIYGRIVEDKDVHEMALKRFPLPSTWTTLKATFRSLVLDMLLLKGVLRDSVQRFSNYSIPLEGFQSPKELYHKIEDCLFDANEMFIAHIRVSTASMLWNLFTIATLSPGASDYTIEHYNDFAMLVGKGNGAISGDVPSGLKELAVAIKKEKSKEEFSSMSTQVALEWLINGKTQACVKFQSFLERHGHRGHKEYELSAITWGMEPVKLIKVLQTMVAAPSEAEGADDANPSVEEVIKQIKTNLTPMKKRFLSFILPRCRRAITSREQTKTMLIKINYCIRFAYLKLGEMLVQDGRIPDARFIFFLTHDEIGRIIKHRSARIINRAAQRQRLFPAMDCLHFREFLNGDPKAIEEEDAIHDKAYATSTKITAYPVCQGTAKGPARVILHIDDIDQIKAGDILVTICTDIAWSPYFPLLSGVVTEVGGLISHGAVVAREYGIPCIVGAMGATKIFKSGDAVLLNATKGTLEKIKEI